MFCVVCTAKFYFDLGNIPETMVLELAKDYGEQPIVAIREKLLSSTYDEIEPIFERLAAVSARYGYEGVKIISSS